MSFFLFIILSVFGGFFVAGFPLITKIKLITKKIQTEYPVLSHGSLLQ